MNEVRAYESQGLITFAWAKNSTIGTVHAPLQSISSPSCSTPAAFPIRGLSQAEAASGAEWCQTVWWFCDRARWGLWWDEAHFHPRAEQRCEFRWKDGVLGLLVLTSHVKIMKIRINWKKNSNQTSSAQRLKSHRKVCWVNVKKIHKIAKVVFIADFLTCKREGLSEWNARQRKESLAQIFSGNYRRQGICIKTSRA